MKKALKLLGKILLVLVILIAVILTVCFFYQKSAQKKDRELLEHDGFCNLVSAGDYDMNLNIYGDGDITVVAMPGNGDAAFTIDMKVFSTHLRDDIRLAVVTRPGYGLSSETTSDVTTEYIVESTRTALKNAGIEAPYVLMPHSLSGIYGTYWENTYPEEVSGVIFLDSINEATPEITDENWTEPPALMRFLCKAGLFRALNDWVIPDGDDGYGAYSADNNALYDVNPTAFSPSCISELKHFNENMQTAWGSIRSNDIPKIYISTDFKSMEDCRAYVEHRDGTIDEAEVQDTYDRKQEEASPEYVQKRADFIEKVGNCREVNIPGSHFVYWYQTEDCAAAVNDFIDSLT